MDQKGTEDRMLALTDGAAAVAEGGRGSSSSYVMLPSDRKAVAEARGSASQTECDIAEAKRAFARKGSLGLWWDARGIFNSSDPEVVVNHMETHRKFYEGVVTFTVMVEKGDANSYKALLDLYEELSMMEDEAVRDAKNNKSKSICRMLREFLNEKYKLDHNLKRVECVVLKQKIDAVEQSCERSRDEVNKIGDEMRILIEESRAIKEGMRESQDRAAKLQAENAVCRSLVERLVEEKDELKEAMEKKMEELSLEADRRAEEANRRSEARIQKMNEQNQRELQKITQLLSSMKDKFPYEL